MCIFCRVGSLVHLHWRFPYHCINAYYIPEFMAKIADTCNLSSGGGAGAILVHSADYMNRGLSSVLVGMTCLGKTLQYQEYVTEGIVQTWAQSRKKAHEKNLG